MKIAIGSDHAGYKLKAEIVHFLSDNRKTFKDFGVKSADPVDYPDIAVAVADAVASKEFDFGILICGTGVGMSIAANKVPGIRAVVCSDTFTARLSREHNNANVLTFGSRVVGVGVALDIVNTWLSTEFSEDQRHINRLEKITEIEQRC